MTDKDVHVDTLEIILQRVAKGELLSATLSSPRDKAQQTKKINLRPIHVKQRLVYQCTKQQAAQVMHENLAPEACASFLSQALKEFSQASLCFADADYHLLVSKKLQTTIIKKPPTHTSALPIAHNRAKHHVLADGVPVPFLIELGVMTAAGKVIAKKYDKFRQINRFLEMVRDVSHHLPKDRPLHIVDFGCGKAYLTFALYHYLHHIEGRQLTLTGLDLKRDVIAHCQALAHRLSYAGLHFAIGDIKNHQPAGKLDMMVALHACDTATDAALERAVRWDADIILCAPCCQHELYKQLYQPSCDTLLRHGVLRERLAALATDAARADILTMLGYDVQLLEFIDMEHTPKNILIRAVKEKSPHNRQAAKERYLQFKKLFHITPTLETHFSSSSRWEFFRD